MSDSPQASRRKLVVRVAELDERTTALGLMLGEFTPEERRLRLNDVLSAVDLGELCLDGLLIAHLGNEPVGAVLAVAQADRMAFAWPPGVALPDDMSLSPVEATGGASHDDTAALRERIEAALWRALNDWLDQSGTRFAQILLEPESPVDRRRVVAAGFQHVTDLQLRQRWLLGPMPAPALPTCRAHRYGLETADRFAALIERTYVGSLDCPSFVAWRTGVEALESHRQNGRFDPDRWTLFETDAGDVALLLLSPHPDERACELVYLGVAPEARGAGWGRALVRFGLAEAQRAGAERLLLSVDSANRYAIAAYESEGIVAEGTRSIFLRWSRPPGDV